jgi:hypothetical protein
MKSFSLSLGFLLVCTGAVACSSDASTPTRQAAIIAPLAAPIALTDVRSIVPKRALPAEREARTPIEPASRKALLAEGWGAFDFGPGASTVERTFDGAPPPAPGPNRKRLVRFAHLADFQLADDESPTRLVAFDGPQPFESAARTQEGHECRIVNAVVRTVNRVHQDAPVDFVLLGGDNVDSGQENELDWVLALLGGAPSLACDSGDVSDPIPGPDNDGKDPFVPEGLAMPWYWVTGNHDPLIQGNFIIDARRIEESESGFALGGTRDYTQDGAVIKEGVVPDKRRAAMTRDTMIARVTAHTGRAGPAAHGLGAWAQKTKKAFYTQDVGVGIRLLVMDTAAETGGSEGVLLRADFDGFVVPEIARAKADGKLVIMASHHASTSLGDGSGLGGTKHDDAVATEEFEATLADNPHVIASIVGHSHRHRVRHIDAKAPSTNGGLWEVMTSAIADFPHEFRMIEVWDEDNGQITIRSMAVDYATDGDKVAADGRTLAIMDYTTNALNRVAAPADQNVVLWSKKAP